MHDHVRQAAAALAPALLAALLAALAAGCSPATGTAGAPLDTPSPVPAAASDIPTPAGPADDLPAPPAAYLRAAGDGGPGAPGAEGSFTWNGTGSDAPWVVLPEPAARGSGPWTVAFDPPVPAEGWTARWAPVKGGVAGEPAAATRGAGPAIAVEPPAEPGRWSLQLEASFGTGRRAAWYWTVDAMP